MVFIIVQNFLVFVEFKIVQKKKVKVVVVVVKVVIGIEFFVFVFVVGGENLDDSFENGYICEFFKQVVFLDKMS